MNGRGRALAGLLALVLVLSLVGEARAQQANVKVDSPVYLFDDVGEQGWVPVTIPLENKGSAANVTITVEVQRNAAVCYSATKTVSLEERAKRREVVWVHADPGTDRVKVKVETGAGLPRLLPERLLGHHSRGDGNYPMLRALFVREGAPDATPISWLKLNGPETFVEQSARAVSGSELPDQASGYDAVDLVVLSKTGERDLDQQQRRSLLDWVQRGGSVLLLPGADPAWLRDDLIGRFLPPDAEVSVAEAPMRTWVWSALERSSDLRGRRPTLRAYTVKSESVAPGSEDDWPLFSHWRVGAGLVAFLRVDLEAAPFDDWARAKETIARGLLTGQGQVGVLGRNARAWPQDPALENALEVGEAPSPLWMVPVVLAYIACVGPINFTLLKRRNAQVLILATTPLVAVAFTVFVFLNGYVARGFRTVVERATVLEVRSGEDYGVQRTGLSIYSSSSSTYKVVGDAALLVRHAHEKPRDDKSADAVERVVQDGGRFAYPTVPLTLWERAFFEGRGLRSIGGRIAIALDPKTDEAEISNRSTLSLGKGVVAFRAAHRDGRSPRADGFVCTVPPLAPGKSIRVSPQATSPKEQAPTAVLTDGLVDEKMDPTFVRRALAGSPRARRSTRRFSMPRYPRSRSRGGRSPRTSSRSSS